MKVLNLDQQADADANADAAAKIKEETPSDIKPEAKTQKTREELLEEQNRLLQEEVLTLKQQLEIERRRPVSRSSIYDMVCFYGCPNSSRVKKLHTARKKK